MNGKIHSIESMGGADGPGLRMVIFTQGCVLRCPYCHNPDTWNFSEGKEISSEELIRRALRLRSYFGSQGGVTLSGGEPLCQAEFAADLFEKLHEAGIGTALDTSGNGCRDEALLARVLKAADYVLCDIKFPDELSMNRQTGGSLEDTLRFLSLAEAAGSHIWIRHVVVPGLTDNEQTRTKIRELAARFAHVERIEWLPFKKYCVEKYQRLGLVFPLSAVPEKDGQPVIELIK